RVPDPEHAGAGPVAGRAVPGHALSAREPRHLPARGGTARALAGDPLDRPLRCGPARPRAAHPGGPDVSRGALTRILVIAYQEVLLLRHNPSVLSMVFMQPPMMLFLFGVCISNTPANVPWVVLDRSNTAMSRRLVAEIEHTGYVLPPRAVDGYAEVTEQLRRGDAVAALGIPHDLA